MTLFAVACAAMFPLLHTGRPWLAAYWLFPYPNTMGLWPQFRSPLIWDVFAVSTYVTVSLLFWFTGLIPDLATLRDSAKSTLARRIFGVLALGWRGSARHWQRYETIYLLLAGLSTPLVLSVHTVVSFDFAVSHAARLARHDLPALLRRRRDLLRIRHGDDAGDPDARSVRARRIHHHAAHPQHDEDHARHGDDRRLRLRRTRRSSPGTAANLYEAFMMSNRMTGPYAVFYWSLISINALMIQLFWFRSVRDNIPLLFVLSLLVNVGMWLERFIIIVTSLHRDFLPSSWDMYAPTRWDFGMFTGTIGLFLSLFFLFVRLLPAISIFEVRTLVPEAKLKTAEDHG